MNASKVIERAKELHISLRADGEYLYFRPEEAAPPEFVELLRQHKVELLQYLHDGLKLYKQRYPNAATPDLAEAEEIADTLERKGCVLMWSGALQAAIAVYLAESDRAKVPSGFTAYSQEELFKLWLGEAPSLSALRMVHKAKKYGGQVIESGEYPKERRKLKG
jgi:hypothetical protein